MPLEEDLAAGGRQDPGQTVQERRLARPTRAHDGEDLAGSHRQAGTPQRRRRAEREMDVAGLDDASLATLHGRKARGIHDDRTTSARAESRAVVMSIHRRSASRWNRPWSARSASTTPPVRRCSVSSRMRRRWAARWMSR